MSKIILQGHIIVSEKALTTVKEALLTHVRLTRAEPGCLIFEVKQDKGNACKFTVYEEFVDQNAFDYHQLRVKSSHWGLVIKNVQRHYQITQQ